MIFHLCRKCESDSFLFYALFHHEFKEDVSSMAWSFSQTFGSNATVQVGEVRYLELLLYAGAKILCILLILF